MSVKLSKAGKMPCKSWSLQALLTCPAAYVNKKLNILVDACKGCYATDGNYRFKNVIAPRMHNMEDWKRDDWVADMVAAIGNDPYFRWFDSGDVYHYNLLLKIFQVIEDTPDTMHWLPTRMHNYPKFRKVLDEINQYENAVVRFSSNSVLGGIVEGQYSSTIIPEGMETTATVCPAYQNKGKCGDCRQCWNRNVQVIAYPQHGRKMKKVNNDLIPLSLST